MYKYYTTAPTKVQVLTYSDLCEICGKEHASFTADPDHGSRMLCPKCQQALGYDQKSGGRHD